MPIYKLIPRDKMMSGKMVKKQVIKTKKKPIFAEQVILRVKDLNMNNFISSF